MNLLDLPTCPRPGIGVYWGTILASVVIHGGFLAYVLGGARSPGQPSRLRLPDVTVELVASPLVPTLRRADREVSPSERAEAIASMGDADMALPGAEALARQMNDALPEDNAIAARSLPLPEEMSKDRLPAGPLPATVMPDRRARAPMSMPSRRISRLPGEQRLSERHVADPHEKAPALAPLLPLKLPAVPPRNAPDATSEEGRALALDMSVQGEPVAAVLPREAGVAMLGARIIDNAPMLPEDRASPLPPEAPAPPMQQGLSAAAATVSTDIEHPVPAKKPAAAEKASLGKTKAKGEPSPAASKTADRYRAKVRSHLAAHRPAGRGGSGSATVAFELSPKGRVLSARIARSSGNPAIDQSVVQSVYRSEPFPKPPGEMEAKQLRFVIPFEFR